MEGAVDADARGLGGVPCDEELAAALWAALVPRVARCSASFGELERRLHGGEAPPTAAELRAAAGETEALGWLLGCVAEGLDHGLFSDRRAAQGLGWMLELLRAACAERGRRLVVHAESAVPGEEPTRTQLWACAEVLWLASECSPAALECRVERRGAAWCLFGRGPLAAAVAERALRWSGRAPEVLEAGWTWSVGCTGAGGAGA